MMYKGLKKRFSHVFLSVVILLGTMQGLTIREIATVYAGGDTVPFYIGNALHYADTNDSLYRSEPLTTQTDNITMEAWVKAETISSAATNIRIMYNGNSSTRGYGIYLAGASKYPSILMGNVAFIGMVTPETINTGVWYHLAAVRDNGIWKLYINGVEKPLNSNTLAPNPILLTDSFSIGNNNLVPESFNGCFDEVRFWTVARSGQQIRDNMYLKLHGDEEGLLAYYNFDQENIIPGGNNSAITTVTDLAGGNQNLTMSGFAKTGSTSNFIQSVQLGQFQFENTVYSVREYAGSVRVAVTRTGGSEGTVTLNYSTSNGTAMEGTHYTSTNGSVTFVSGETRKEIDIPIINSAITEVKTFNISLSAQSGVPIGSGNASISIEPNDAKSITAFSFTGLNPVVTGIVNEAAKTISLTVPYGSDVAALVPTIAHTGYSVSPASGEPRNFTSPVTYNVQAADGSNQEYVVTVKTLPTALNVQVSGTTQVGRTLVGSYTFYDAGGDSDASALKWYRSDNNEGLNKALIGDATDITYTLEAADIDKYISFEVTPKTASGALLGTEIVSSWIGPVTKKTQNVVIYNDVTKTYGDAPFEHTAAGGSGTGVFSYTSSNPSVAGIDPSTGTVTIFNSGTTTLTATKAADGEFNQISCSCVLTVEKKVLTATAIADNKSYDGTTAATGTVNLSGKVGVEDVSASGVFTFESAYAGEGKTVNVTGITLSGEKADNYTVNVSAITTADINKVSMEGISFDHYTVTYDGTEKRIIVAGELPDGASVIYTGNIGTNAGIYNATAIVSGGTNYNDMILNATLTINKKILEATAVANNKAYDGNKAASGTITLIGRVGGDDVTASAVFEFEDADVGAAKTVNVKDISLRGPKAENYSLNNITAKITADIYRGANGLDSKPIPPAPSTQTPTLMLSPRSTPSPTSTAMPEPIKVIINGVQQEAASADIKNINGKTLTTITLDDKKVEEKLKKEGERSTLVIPVNIASDIVVGELNGQTVKNMEQKHAVLEVKTADITYTLPASQINIDEVSLQLGKKVELKDIKVNVTISKSLNNIEKIVEDTANKNNYNMVIKPIEFEITCTNGNKTIEVSSFNAYVERMVAIPDGVDPSKITTGIVLNTDGTFSHVPTTITVIDSKYYAKINSLTNSVYSIIWSPKTFRDVENHWSKVAINDMGSRLVIDGVGQEVFEPDSYTTRAEFTAIVVRALGIMKLGAGKDVFSDVTKELKYYDAISIAYKYGIVSGYGNGKFGTLDIITREQAFTMLARAMKLTKINVGFKLGEVESILEKFEDWAKNADWAKESVAACIKAGIIAGRSEKKLASKENMTRAEAAVMVRKLLKTSGLI
ncbi:MAG TPA: S-layer homology domain-containing protein [Pseudobacteroides sp.]|uniref:S-layer homology domain-containing protein n=1 Tax=Pseudobacteroides sp. TaxID=1968840 RepID=UPI002F937493